MKTKISFILNDFINKMNEEEIVNIYDKTGFSKNMAIKSIPEEFRKKVMFALYNRIIEQGNAENDRPLIRYFR